MLSIVNVTWSRMNLNYGSCYKIDSEENLIEYWSNSNRSAQLMKGYEYYLTTKECNELAGNNKNCYGEHAFRNPESFVLYTKHRTEVENNIFPQSLPQLFTNLINELYNQMLVVLRERGCIYINPTKGSYFGFSNELLETPEPKNETV